MAFEMDTLYNGIVASLMDGDRPEKKDLVRTAIAGKKAEITSQIFETYAEGQALVKSIAEDTAEARKEADEEGTDPKVLEVFEAMMDGVVASLKGLALS